MRTLSRKALAPWFLPLNLGVVASGTSLALASEGTFLQACGVVLAVAGAVGFVQAVRDMRLHER